MLPELCRQTPNDNMLCFDSIKGAFDILGKGRQLFSEVITLVTMYYVFPASSATAESSFSSIRCLTYLRSTMTETRINNLLVLHVHKKRTDTLDVMDVAMQFVFEHENRTDIFCTDFNC